MKQASLYKNIFTPGGLLAITALFGTGILFIINLHSSPYIKENERQVLLKSVNSVLDNVQYDNDILEDTLKVYDKIQLGHDSPSLIYRVRKNKQPIAAVITVIAPNGYSGQIKLLVGINTNNAITGVRVVKHKETPGLGDGIEKQRSDWIDIFLGKSLRNPKKGGWKVKRDGGEFDQLTGATITPRAIVGAVYKALLYFRTHYVDIFSDPDADI